MAVDLNLLLGTCELKGIEDGALIFDVNGRAVMVNTNNVSAKARELQTSYLNSLELGDRSTEVLLSNFEMIRESGDEKANAFLSRGNDAELDFEMVTAE